MTRARHTPIILDYPRAQHLTTQPPISVHKSIHKCVNTVFRQKSLASQRVEAFLSVKDHETTAKSLKGIRCTIRLHDAKVTACGSSSLIRV